jgi:serpin B
MSRRQRAPAVAPQQNLAAVVDANTAFALDLYRRLRSDDANLVFSPYSVSLALAMTYAGARGDTAAEMRKVLHLSLPADRLHAALNSLSLLVAHPPEAQNLAGLASPPEIRLVNSLWAQADYPWRQEFLDLLAADYGAGLRSVDFTGDPDGAAVAINKWVTDETNDRIQRLIPPGVIDVLTRFVLANAVYLKATWTRSFPANATTDGPFQLPSGQSRSVPMMHLTSQVDYGQGDGYQTVDLPYWGGYSMTVILPGRGRFVDVEASLTPGRLKAILDQQPTAQVTLTMPRFRFETDAPLNDTLIALGMRTAFVPPPADSSADFTGMTPLRELYVKYVAHKAFITVDEQGTEAAAATAVVGEATAAVRRTATVTVDRPFIFVIRDKATGSVVPWPSDGPNAVINPPRTAGLSE